MCLHYPFYYILVLFFAKLGSKLPTYNITTVSAQASRHQSGSGNIKTTSSSKSWLVLETLEQPLNFTRHYLMPNQIEKRWRKRDWSSQKLRGTRLHIFMDHVFVSKRIKRYIKSIL
jgi:hypothetical protein